MAIASTLPSCAKRLRAASVTWLRHSHMTRPVPLGTRNARWPMAKVGRETIVITPAHSTNSMTRSAFRMSADVHFWPLHATYCRSSLQIRQESGGSMLGEYWVPHVAHIHAVAEAAGPSFVGRCMSIMMGPCRYHWLRITHEEAAATRGIIPAQGEYSPERNNRDRPPERCWCR